MLAEALAVVGGNDHPGPLETAPAIEFVDQLTKLLVKIGDAVVVRVTGKERSARR